MRIDRRWRPAFALLMVASLAVPAAISATIPAMAQQLPAAAPATAPATAAPPAKPKPKPKSPATPAAAPAAKPEGSAPAKPAVTNGARLLGQYGQWGAYTASPSGKKVCFVISQPTSAQTVPPNRPRNPVYMFISTRPADKVVNEVSVIAGYPFKPSLDATAAVGSTTFALYTQQDGAWIKNAGDEANMLSAMRAGDSIVVKGVSAKGTQSSDTYTLKGISQALDRVAQECK